ncbi:MAG: flavin reductase [Clostridia bacterium]|nr:flavin reductase [Clostridia bacterium]
MQELDNKSLNIFKIFNKDWALVTAGGPDSYNCCTISWGSLGSIWHGEDGAMPIATVYINPARYTWEFMKRSEYFTVSFFGEEYKKALGYLGSHSGRDGDKVAEAGLTPVPAGPGVTYSEAKLTFVCRKIYQAPFEREGMADDITNGIYANWEPHWMFVGEIVETVE